MHQRNTLADICGLGHRALSFSPTGDGQGLSFVIGKRGRAGSGVSSPARDPSQCDELSLPMTAIFISHRSSDNAEAQALKDWLGAAGPRAAVPRLRSCRRHPGGRGLGAAALSGAAALPGAADRADAGVAGVEVVRERARHRPREGQGGVRRPGQAVPGRPADPGDPGGRSHARSGCGPGEARPRACSEHGLDPRDAFDWKPDRPIYPGLAAFDVDDAAIFFGRSEESWQAVEALRRMRLQATGSPKLLLITGASGSGKSSLMRAGVLARLRKEPASWIAARPFRRGTDALGALADALAWAFPPDRRPTSLEAITARLTGPDGAGQLLALARELRLALDRPEATLVLALDQAEELLAAERGDDAAKLLDLFRATLAAVGNEILVIATIRSDRLGAWQQHASIKATADHGELPFEMLPLGPMPMARIGEIVRGPAAYEGLQHRRRSRRRDPCRHGHARRPAAARLHAAVPAPSFCRGRAPHARRVPVLRRPRRLGPQPGRCRDPDREAERGGSPRAAGGVRPRTGARHRRRRVQPQPGPARHAAAARRALPAPPDR